MTFQCNRDGCVDKRVCSAGFGRRSGRVGLVSTGALGRMLRCGNIPAPSGGSIRVGARTGRPIAMNAPTPLHCRPARATRSRLREIPYNYTRFRIGRSPFACRVRGLGLAAAVGRSAAHTGRSARILHEVLGDIWVVQRNPTCRTTCSTTPSAVGWALLVEALHHRLREVDKRRTPGATARDALVAELLAMARAAVEGFDAGCAE